MMDLICESIRTPLFVTHFRSTMSFWLMEGQDYRPVWWDALRGGVTPEREKLLASDKTRNIYGTANAWTKKRMGGAEFSDYWWN